jgi:hypothetical protein
MMKTPHEILKEARARIQDHDDWFRGEADGGVGDAQPHQFCSRLAISYASANSDNDVHEAAEAALISVMGCRIVQFNAEHTHAEVLAAFDKAIAATAPKQKTDISIFCEMLKTRAPLVDHQSAVDTCGNG